MFKVHKVLKENKSYLNLDTKNVLFFTINKSAPTRVALALTDKS
jgi:hypothetical protein